MAPLDTALASRVRSARDRMDVLVLGRASAARHRVLRLLDPVAAVEMRSAALGRSEPSADSAAGFRSMPTGRGLAARARLAAWHAVPAA